MPILLLWLLLLVPLAAQVPLQRPPRKKPRPVFSPPNPALQPTAKQQPQGASKQLGAVPSLKQPAGLDALFARLRRWPKRQAREAGILLAGLGAKARSRLLAGLGDNDWRMRAGCAFVLGEMHETNAISALTKAIDDPSNRAGLEELMKALAHIDPAGAPAVILPFMTHGSARIRHAAWQALPAVLSPRYLPDIVRLQRYSQGRARVLALRLLGRIPGTANRPEFLHALGDPDVHVAAFAAEHLAHINIPAVWNKLLEQARTATLRKATYAMLALVQGEDLFGQALIPGKGLLEKRALELLKGRDPFYRGAAAIVLGNLSYRSNDPVLRKLADDYLVNILLYTVAGGVYFRDYAALEPLCFRKLELLCGQTFGRNAGRWRAWWSRHAIGFVARRELHALRPEDLSRCTLILIQRGPAGKLTRMEFSGDPLVLQERGAGPLVLGPSELKAVQKTLAETHFFETRSALPPAGQAGGFVEVEVRLGPSRFSRFHKGAGDKELMPLLALLRRLAMDLAWQRFIGVEPPARRLRRLRAEQKWFAAHPEPSLRRRHRLELALETYPRLPQGARRLAVDLFQEADPVWLDRHAAALGKLLEKEQRLNAEAVALIKLLAKNPDPDVRSVILDAVVQAPPVRGRQVLGSYLALQPLPVVMRLMSDERALVRAAAYRAAPRFKNHSQIANLLIEGLKDYEPAVREACVSSLAALSDQRVLALLESLLEGQDKTLRVRAIPALARAGGDHVTNRLMEIYRQGSREEKWAVLKALRTVGGKRAVVALAGVVRETGSLEFQREALEGLVTLGGMDVAERIEALLVKQRDPLLKSLLIGALRRVLSDRARQPLLPFLKDPDPGVARAAAINLGLMGAREALDSLFKLMGSVGGDVAAERALEALTFQEPQDASPARRLGEFLRWRKAFGAHSRQEWFLLAARSRGLVLDGKPAWLLPGKLDRQQIQIFLTLLKSGNRPQRWHADRMLQRASDLPLEPLNFGASLQEARERAGIYARWAKRRKQDGS